MSASDPKLPFCRVQYQGWRAFPPCFTVVLAVARDAIFFAQFSGARDYSRRSNARVSGRLTETVSTRGRSGSTAGLYSSFQGVGLSLR